jgi:hypothetical protein
MGEYVCYQGNEADGIDVQLFGDGYPVDGKKEFYRTGGCKGCKKYPKSKSLPSPPLHLNLLVLGVVIVECYKDE